MNNPYDLYLTYDDDDLDLMLAELGEYDPDYEAEQMNDNYEGNYD